jgi:hypothetical protein
MTAIAANPRAVIGGNNPPEDTAIDRAKPIVAELNGFLAEHPVIANEGESRRAKDIRDRVIASLHGVERERDSKVRPLNDEVSKTNATYHVFHNVNKNKPGTWDKLLAQLTSRLTNFAKLEEEARLAKLAAARKALEEAERLAREKEEAAWRAKEEADQGVCDVDLGAAIEAAQVASQRAMRADRIAQRAERDSKVRIVGGIGNAISLRDHEVLTVADWKAAIEEMSQDGIIPNDIAAAVLKCARAHRKAFGELPEGITATFERGL